MCVCVCVCACVCVYGAVWSSNSARVLAPLSLSLREATQTARCIFLTLSHSLSHSLSLPLSLSLYIWIYIFKGGWLTFSGPYLNPHLNLITVLLELNLRKRRTYMFRPLPTHFQALTYQPYSCLLTCVGVHLPSIHELRRATRAMPSTQVYTYTYIHTHI